MICEKHRPVQISYEAIYADKFQFGQPIKEVYYFKCFCCEKVTTLECKNKQA